MRVITNDKLIERRSRYARYAAFGGMGLLLASLVSSFRSDYLALAYAALFAGFILAYIGSVLANKWLKQPRADQALVKSLKGLDQRYHLYNFLLPAPHVLLTPTGVLVFKTKSHEGAITRANGKWSQAWRWSRLFGGMGEEPLGNPLVELDEEIAKMRKLLAKKIPSAEAVPLEGYVVFTDPRAQLSLDDPNLPVVRADNLKETLRKSKRGPALPPQLFADVEKALNDIAEAKTAQ